MLTYHPGFGAVCGSRRWHTGSMRGVPDGPRCHSGWLDGLFQSLWDWAEYGTYSSKHPLNAKSNGVSVKSHVHQGTGAVGWLLYAVQPRSSYHVQWSSWGRTVQHAVSTPAAPGPALHLKSEAGLCIWSSLWTGPMGVFWIHRARWVWHPCFNLSGSPLPLF